MGGAPLWIVEPDAALRPILAAAVDGVTAMVQTTETAPETPPPLTALILSLRPGEAWPDWASRVPTVALVAKGEARTWPAGWEVLEKPLHPALLRAAVLRLLEAPPPVEILALPGGSLHLTQRVLTGPHGQLRLTEKEVALLRHLLAAPAPVPRADLLESLWGYRGDTATRTVETHLYRLRRKLQALGLPLRIEAGAEGYCARPR